MGYGWELQAGALLVVENGEFRFRDKIKLTDEGGSVTDTYTFDAFGNLTSSTGDTENSYLYRGEQFDSFTGLYYLRARYMNPSTGTFITMDEYAGSVFEPVSLHKYLYANANPVMNSDPTGYYTLMDCQIATTISNTLNKMLVSNGMGILNGILEMFTTILAGGTQSEIQDSFLRGFFNGFMMGGGYSALSQLAGCIPLLKLMVAAYDGYMAIGNFMAAGEAWQNEDYVAAIYYAVSGAVGLYYAGKTAMQTCFTGDTLVAAENGQKRIDEIEVGDKVWAFNVETGESELKTVTKVYVHSVDEILHLYTDEGDIDTTANHLFYVIGKGWVAAGDLAVGDEVYNLDETASAILGLEIEILDDPVLVYNLEVEDFHSFFVGCVPVLVHNYNNRPKNYTPEGAGRRGAFREAKRLNDVPVSEQPKVGPNYDRRGNVQPGRSYMFKNGVVIRDDAAGHIYPDPSQNRGSHFNDPQGRHFDY